MSYTVAWEPDALDALALIWMQAVDRRAVTQAQAEIDRWLALDPHGQGRLVSEELFAIDVPPLRAFFEVFDDSQIVTVVTLRNLP